MRTTIMHEVNKINPFDATEEKDKRDVIAWIESGMELCRLQKPAIPPKHLISYFVVIDAEYLLLVDHINAGLWLPPGGHVEPKEHPRTTVVREALEELSLTVDFAHNGPTFVTVTDTVGATVGHTDVSLWYVVNDDRHQPITFDDGEFHGAAWFHRSKVPVDRSDPQISRFLRKYFGSS